MQRVSKRGVKYSKGSSHSWAEWQKPPVMCVRCGKRVTLKDSFQGDNLAGTWHLPDCAPVRVRVIVEAA